MVDAHVKGERPDCHNKGLQAWAENAPAFHASAAYKSILHANELNALKEK